MAKVKFLDKYFSAKEGFGPYYPTDGSRTFIYRNYEEGAYNRQKLRELFTALEHNKFVHRRGFQGDKIFQISIIFKDTRQNRVVFVPVTPRFLKLDGDISIYNHILKHFDLIEEYYLREFKELPWNDYGFFGYEVRVWSFKLSYPTISDMPYMHNLNLSNRIQSAFYLRYLHRKLPAHSYNFNPFSTGLYYTYW